jgi:predicted esterase
MRSGEFGHMTGNRSRPVLLTAVVFAVLSSVSRPHAEQEASPAVGLQQNVRFEQYSPLATNQALIQRLLSPLAAELVREQLAASGRVLAEQPVELRVERFTLYVPATRPPGGYGLLVFVPPWPQAKVPPGWSAVLDRSGVIFVTAARSGNEETVISRRAALALVAAQNVLGRYPVNLEHVYIGGFSGGSRVALRLALAYPDVFHGAFLNAGSDPIGGVPMPAPARKRLYQLQEESRIVAATGANDAAVLSRDDESARSLAKWCVFGVAMKVTPSAGHQIASADVLADALDRLQAAPRADPTRLAACRAGLEAELAAGIAPVEADIAAGRTIPARQKVYALDKRFGGYADDRIVKLAQACQCGVLTGAEGGGKTS